MDHRDLFVLLEQAAVVKAVRERRLAGARKPEHGHRRIVADGLDAAVAGHHVQPHTDGPGQGEGPFLALAEIPETEDGDAVFLLVDDHEPVRELGVRPLGVRQHEDVRLVELLRDFLYVSFQGFIQGVKFTPQSSMFLASVAGLRRWAFTMKSLCRPTMPSSQRLSRLVQLISDLAEDAEYLSRSLCPSRARACGHGRSCPRCRRRSR